jgi:wyosine [tRNA(Phe)-imidazoG37] synthetase (radical SAM superfamily)
MPRKFTYGPFQSRRLGLSLGVNILLDYKICSYDCVYCEIGATNKERLVPPEYRIKLSPTPDFRKELKSILKYVPHLKSLSFTGYYGEPTLNSYLLDFYNITLDVRNELKWDKDPPLITLFTNSSTLYLEEIRERVKHFDLVLAKLDAATDKDLRITNRPHKDCPDIDTLADSLVKLRKDMPNKKLAIQCLISKSYRDDFSSNDNNENIEQLAHLIKKINPNIVQLYSIARIPSEYFVYAIDEKRKKEIVKIFREIINNELIEINYY